MTPSSQTSAARDDFQERSGLKTGRSYIESLRDGREVWVHGQRVADVTKHRAFEGVTQTIGSLYDLQHQAATRDVMTYVDENGIRGSISYMPPRSPKDLLRRRRNTEVWTERSFGMFGRLPDFCAAMIVGFHDLHDELNALHEGFGDNATRFLTYARQNDLVLSHALHDPHMDKTLRPNQDPDRCLRIVKERDDGIVVRGARFSTLAPLANEVVVAPTYVLNPDEAEFAIWFACSMDSPGLKQVCRDPISLRPATADHPLSSKYDEQDVLLIFDDVLIPWERVFLMRKPKEANVLFRSRVMSWAGYASALQLLARLELLIGTAHLIAETGGVATRPFVTLDMGELTSYAGMFKGLLRAAEVDCVRTPAGHYGLGDTSHLRPLITMTSERIINIFEHVATSSIVFTPTAEDFSVPDLKRLLNVYGRGKGVDAEYRYKLCRLAWELSASSFGGRQQLYERLHSGSPEVLISNAYRQYDKAKGIAMVNRLIG